MVANSPTPRPRSARAAHANGPCAHCGLRVPPGLIDEHAAAQYCCHGCETAATLIKQCGLEKFYAIRGDATTAPAAGTTKKYTELDDATFQRLYVRDAGAGLRRVELLLEGVHCSACVWLVEKLPALVDGVIQARLELGRGLVSVVWDPQRTQLSRAARTLDSLGYPPHPARESSARLVRRTADRKALARLGVAGACAGNVMLLGLALYAGLFDVMEPEYRQLFRWLSMAISVVSLAWPGSVFFRGAWASVRTRTLNLDLPIAMGLGIGAVWGVVNTVRGTGEIYFDSLSVLVFALLVGRFIQQRQQRSTTDAVELLFSMTPASARLVVADDTREVPTEALEIGQVVEVRAGDSIPVDGVIVLGTSSVDQSLLTGESTPVRLAVGDNVTAGGVNVSSVLRVRVNATGEHTRVAALMRLVREGSLARAPIVQAADRLAGWFVAVMLALAAITLALWWNVSPSVAIDHAAALLIVTCPCGLGLATPLAMTVALGRAAKRGILIKSSAALERLAKPGTIFLDKTGTITQGRTGLVRWLGNESALTPAAALENGSSHPIARAMRSAAGEEAFDPEVSDSHEITGRGIVGVVDGRRVAVGSPAFVRETVEQGSPRAIVQHGPDKLGSTTPSTPDAWEAEILQAGLTPVFVAIQDRIVAAGGFGDPLRAEASATLSKLTSIGWRVAMLSGDHPEIAQRVGNQVGLDASAVRGGLSPEEKLAAVKAELRNGPVVMVGDGVNDAAALAAATVGIAVHGGAEASLAAADAYLGKPDLGQVATLLSAARSTMAVIHRNLAVSLAYNLLAAALCVTGHINPLLAAVLMPASSLTVVSLSFRTKAFGGARCP